jgi:hypothetical protein
MIPEPYGSLQRRLLEAEGVEIGERRHVDMPRYIWLPAKKRSSGRKRRVAKPR